MPTWITGVNLTNKEDVIQQAEHQALVETVMVKDIDEERQGEDEVYADMQLTTGWYDQDPGSDSESEDEDKDNTINLPSS